MGGLTKIMAGVLGAGIALALGALGFIYWRSEAIMHPHFALRPEPVRPAMAADIARGRHLVDIMGRQEGGKGREELSLASRRTASIRSS